MRKIFLGLALSMFAALLYGAEVLVSTSGGLELSAPSCEIVPKLFTPEWHQKSAGGVMERDAAGRCRFKMVLDDGATIQGTASFKQDEGGAIAAHYTFTFERDVTLNTLYIGLSLPCREWIGGKWSCDDKSGTLPQEFKNLTVLSRTASNIALMMPDTPQKLVFSLPEPTDILIQDDRQWGPTFSLRIGKIGQRTYKAGEVVSINFTLKTDQALSLFYDGPITLTADKDWIPLKTESDIVPGSALDFSKISALDAPAGKHGYVVAKNGYFEYEKLPGVPQRFYGVNICFSANYLEPQEAAHLAGRLARIGYNSLRLHHHDGGLVEGSPDGTTINPTKLAQLDALMAACISNGIYVTTDLFVSRSIPWRSVGVERDGKIAMDEFKALVCIHEGAFENLKNFTRQFLTHVNPYTGRSYAHEPALAWLALVNEGNLGNFLTQMRGIPEWQAAWQKWLAARQAQDPEAFKEVPDTLPKSYYDASRHTAAFTLFLQEVDERFTVRLKQFLRNELGCRALITNRSSWTNRATDQATRSRQYDFVDDHFYVDHPHFLEQKWRLPSSCGNENPLRNSAMGAQGIVYTRLLDKPFTVTEYNYSGPGRFRGVGGIVTGAMGALQDWDGIWRFAFSHSRDNLIKAEGSAMGYFDMAGDPLSLAAERASIALFMRRDLAPLRHTCAMLLPDNKITAMRDSIPMNRAEWSWLAWSARLGTIVAESAPDGATVLGNYPDVYALSSASVRKLLEARPGGLPDIGDGALVIDASNGDFLLKTERTCGGFTESGMVDAGDLIFDVGDTAATVWVSSLENRPIKEASRLLLTHLTDVQNSGIRYAQRSRKVLLAWGGLPHLVRNGKAEIRLAVQPAGEFKVYALSQSGRRVGEVASQVVEGRLAFTAAVDGREGSATMLYEVVRE